MRRLLDTRSVRSRPFRQVRMTPLAVLRVVLPLTFVGAVIACVPDFSAPDGAQITCESDADCPAGRTCRASIHRCVAPGGDQEPPAIVPGSAQVQPAAAGVGREVSVQFSVTEPLALDPEVHLQLASGDRTLVKRAVEGSHYTYVFVADGTEGEGIRSLVATLTDASGNVAPNVA